LRRTRISGIRSSTIIKPRKRTCTSKTKIHNWETTIIGLQEMLFSKIGRFIRSRWSKRNGSRLIVFCINRRVASSPPAAEATTMTERLLSWRRWSMTPSQWLSKGTGRNKGQIWRWTQPNPSVRECWTLLTLRCRRSPAPITASETKCGPEPKMPLPMCLKRST
jgi:hypothetical protein